MCVCVDSLGGFDDVPSAVVIHVALAANALIVAMAVVTLGFNFLWERNTVSSPRSPLERTDRRMSDGCDASYIRSVSMVTSEISHSQTHTHTAEIKLKGAFKGAVSWKTGFYCSV